MREIQREIVSALLISEDDMLFMGKKDPRKGGVYPNAYHIPGGGLDEGETKEEALIRETREETGIDIADYEIALIDDQGSGISNKTLKTGEEVVCHMRFNVYEVRIPDLAVDIRVVLNDDLVEFIWADINELSEYELTPPSVELFRRIGYLKD